MPRMACGQSSRMRRYGAALPGHNFGVRGGPTADGPSTEDAKGQSTMGSGGPRQSTLVALMSRA